MHAPPHLYQYLFLNYNVQYVGKCNYKFWQVVGLIIQDFMNHVLLYISANSMAVDTTQSRVHLPDRPSQVKIGTCCWMVQEYNLIGWTQIKVLKKILKIQNLLRFCKPPPFTQTADFNYLLFCVIFWMLELHVWMRLLKSRGGLR